MQHYIRTYNTVKFLKFTQIIYRIFYVLRSKFRRIRGFRYDLSITSHSSPLALIPSISSPVSYANKTFTFLNLSYTFETGIDWNYAGYGKLWTYNLTYFDFLQQEGLRSEEGLTLIHDFIEQIEDVKDGLEPFPISLRGINWVKFLTRHDVKEQKIDDTLYAQYGRLLDNIEYHLLGNHLLENGFSLLFGAYYFQDEKLYVKAREILLNELNEQILHDGAHFELSPMYHQIMLFRVLDSVNLIKHNSWKNFELLELFKSKAVVMLDWLNTVTYKNGSIPLLNDSANQIAPTTKELNDYAQKLEVESVQWPNITHGPMLSDSGYRKVTKDEYECIVDVGNIGPDYIPGHAHSDTFNFELYVHGKPFIVDTGTSTYETNSRRILERSTRSHNTVEIEGLDQSEVWGGFRVANRAFVVEIEERAQLIKAMHDGYKKRLGALHQREFLFYEKSIKIIDRIESGNSLKAIARLHLYPGLKPIVEGSVITLDEIKIYLNTENARVKVENYYYAPEFNTLSDAQVIEIYFTDHLEMEVQL